jgi:hypothetical protein
MRKHRFVYALAALGALGVALVIGYAASEANMDCHEHTLLKTGEHYTTCYRRH